MAADNAWKTIAEVYRNREHKLIQALHQWIEKGDVSIPQLLEQHLTSTGRDAQKAVDTPVIISPVDDARSELLALLGVSGAPEGASSQPIHIRTRKVRSDKGQPRGPRKVKV